MGREIGLPGARDLHGKLGMVGDLRVGAITLASDRDLKQDFATLEGKNVLDRIAVLPVTSRPEERHIRMMAQDFRAARSPAPHARIAPQ